MTREEFIEILDEKGYSYRIQRNKIIVYSAADVHLEDLTSLPSDVVFTNRGAVILTSLPTLPSGVEFKNRKNVYLNALTSLSPDVVFENGWDVHLQALTSIPSGVVFKNGAGVLLGDRPSISPGVEFKNGNNNIYLMRSPLIVVVGGSEDENADIGNKRLVNLMIKRGMFI